MKRVLFAFALLAVITLTAASKPPKSPSGDAVIRGKAGPSDIVITTTNRLAGAIHSLTWNGKEFIDSADHGRQLQSACAFDCGNSKDFWAEAYNPTEAGSVRDGAGPRSSSWLFGIHAKGNELSTINRPAFWLAPGEKSGNYPAKNKKILSDILITKKVTIGYRSYAHAIDYRVIFSLPVTEQHTLAQFEALTGYMPEEFSQFWTLDPQTGKLAELSSGPGEQHLPIVFSTKNHLWSMGIWSPDQPAKGYDKLGYGRWRFPTAKVVKWNCVFRVKDERGIAPGQYSYRMFVAVGSLENVRVTLNGLMNEREFRKAP